MTDDLLPNDHMTRRYNDAIVERQTRYDRANACFPDLAADIFWDDPGDPPLRCYLLFQNGCWRGYVRYPANWFEITATDAANDPLINYIPVHGRISFSSKGVDGTAVAGFDTDHIGDASNPLITSLDWLKWQCRILAEGLRESSKHELQYRLATKEHRTWIRGRVEAVALKDYRAD